MAPVGRYAELYPRGARSGLAGQQEKCSAADGIRLPHEPVDLR